MPITSRSRGNWRNNHRTPRSFESGLKVLLGEAARWVRLPGGYLYYDLCDFGMDYELEGPGERPMVKITVGTRRDPKRQDIARHLPDKVCLFSEVVEGHEEVLMVRMMEE